MEGDWLDNNTDLLELFRSGGNCFCNNNLEKLSGYNSTDWKDGSEGGGEVQFISTMVWPIRKKTWTSAPPLSQSHVDDKHIGFLRVNSSARSVFSRRLDFGLGATYADALYTVLKSQKLRSNRDAETDDE